MSILTPEQIEAVQKRAAEGWTEMIVENDPWSAVLFDGWQKDKDFRDTRDTLAAYAEVVQQLLDAVAALPIDYPESLEAAVKRAYALVGGDSQAKLIASLRGLV